MVQMSVSTKEHDMSTNLTVICFVNFYQIYSYLFLLQMEKLCRQRDMYKVLCQKGGVMVVGTLVCIT